MVVRNVRKVPTEDPPLAMGLLGRGESTITKRESMDLRETMAPAYKKLDLSDLLIRDLPS